MLHQRQAKRHASPGQTIELPERDKMRKKERVQQMELQAEARWIQIVERAGNYRVHFVTRRKHGGVSVSAQFDLT